jgi:hypothetical protein
MVIPIPKPDYQSSLQTRNDPHQGSNRGAPLERNAPQTRPVLIGDIIGVSYLGVFFDQSHTISHLLLGLMACKCIKVDTFCFSM